MRLFEILLIACTFLFVWLTALHPVPSLMWKRVAVLGMVLAAGAHLVFEGSRWQLYPVYLLTYLVLANLLLRLPKRFMGVVGAMAIFIAITLSVLLPVFRFEETTGPYDIGTVTYHWVDGSRAEVFSSDPKTRREMMVQFWYPAKTGTSLPSAPYVEDADALSAAQARLHGWPSFMLGHLKYVKSNARTGAPVVEEQLNFPVIIFLEGITGYRQMNTFQVEYLVSRGYVVVAIDQPFVAATVNFPDGRRISGWSKERMNPMIQQSITPVQPAPSFNGTTFDAGIIPYFVKDVGFLLDQIVALNIDDPNAILKGRLDLNHIGIFGVSLGGIVVAEACRTERRLRACLVMDAPMPGSIMLDGLQQPSMWITRDAQTMRNENWSKFDIDQLQPSMRAVFEKSTGDGYFVEVSGLFHANLTDIPHFSPLLKWLGITGSIDATRAHNVINAYTVAFFDRYLAGPPATILDGANEQFPEVRLERR
jgi:pimeloyl-ACP methyl ester carboxylesterase